MNPAPSAPLIPITFPQLARVLERAAEARTDVRHATIKVADDDAAMLLVDIDLYTRGRRFQGEIRAARLLDGRTVGEILVAWLGAPPSPPPGEDAAMRAERNRLTNHAPQAVLDRGAPPPNPESGSKFTWKEATAATDHPDGVLPVQIPDPVPAGVTREPNPFVPALNLSGVLPILKADTYPDPVTGETRIVLSRAQMLERNMTREQRHEQYQRQGGRHPLDKKAGGTE